jgi:hypothetical protein
MPVALRSLSLVVALAATAASAAAPDALTSTVFRINGKRYKKVAAGTAAVYIPSVGMPVASALLETVCPKSLTDKDEVLRIGQPSPLDADLQAAEKDLRAAIEACGGATAPVAEKKGTTTDDGCTVTSTDPQADGKGQVAANTGMLGTKCGKTFSK